MNENIEEEEEEEEWKKKFKLLKNKIRYIINFKY